MTAGPHRFLAWLVWCALLPAAACAGPFAQVDSSYLGDGWFRYALTMYDDPFLRIQYMYRIGTTLFTNWLEAGSIPANWVADNSVGGHQAFWDYTGTSNSQVLVYTGAFFVHSTEQGFRTANTFWLHYQFWPELWLKATNWSDGMWGNSVLPCLVPCPPGESDGSPSNLTASFELNPDVSLDGLTPTTLTYAWREMDYTMLISASSNFTHWTNLAYVLSNGTNTWTSAVPLSAYGHVYRVGIVAASHQTNW